LWIRGRKIEAGDLEQIGAWQAAHPHWSRRRLSQELARHWDWRTPAGQLKDIATRDLLNRLEARGLLALPARQRRGGRQRPRAVEAPAQGSLAFPATPPSADPVALGQLLPLSWHLAQGGQPQRALIARYLDAYHYLGYPDPLEQLEQLGPAGQWACQRIIALSLENLRFKQQLDTAQAALRQLEERLEQLQQEAHRQAAPFRRAQEARNPRPGRPGRKAGHPASFRPKPDHVDEQIHVPLEGCPHCGGGVCDKQSLTQYIEEIPVVRPQVTQLTYDVVIQSRAAAVALGVLGQDFAGVLVSDCLAIYDDLNPRQQKCYSHHLKAVSEALKTLGAGGSDYLLQVQALLRTAILLKALQGPAPDERFAVCVHTLQGRAEALLAQPRAPPIEEKVRRRLWKQRDHLFTFLEQPDVPATNNLAERQLRPAVIARKISCGNKTGKGALAWAVLASVASTCRQTGRSFIESISRHVMLQPARDP
jgi:hypothetical protein